MLLCLTCVAAAGCGSGAPTQVQENQTFIKLESDAGDFIGGGQTFNYTAANSTLQVNYSGNHLYVTVLGQWTGDFQLPGNAATLKNGTYAGAVLYPSADATKPAMRWSAPFRECSSATGTFTLQNVRYAADQLRDFDVAFEQHCNGAAPALHGTIHVRR
jgi:hypothetical protein